MSLKSKFALILVVVLCCSCRRYVVFSGYAQGGTYTVKANLSGVKTPRGEIAGRIDAILDSIDFSLSGYNRSSLLSRRNRGEEITPDRFFDECLELSEKYAVLSGGAFDVWSAPLFDAWGFGFTSDSLPSQGVLTTLLNECRAHKKLNFNAIAQGYTSDVIYEYLRSVGVKDMLVDIGEIHCCGLNPSGKPWTVAIDAPLDGNNSPGALTCGIWNSGGEDCGIVTSGNYRKFYVRDGRKYSHTIDPRTGCPVSHDLLSATVVAPTAAEADAIATACMVLGPGPAQDLILSRPELEAFFVFSDSLWVSPGFSRIH